MMSLNTSCDILFLFFVRILPACENKRSTEAVVAEADKIVLTMGAKIDLLLHQKYKIDWYSMTSEWINDKNSCWIVLLSECSEISFLAKSNKLTLLFFNGGSSDGFLMSSCLMNFLVIHSHSCFLKNVETVAITDDLLNLK